jgi:hypothetical protein
MNDSKTPEDGVSGKLKAVVYILTGITLLAFVTFFIKLQTKISTPSQQEKSSANTPRVQELEKTGERLQQAGLHEQALDQYIEIWTLGNNTASTRAKAAATAGRLYLELGNCKEALVWLFRSEAAAPDESLQPLIDTCVAKEK